MCFLTLACGVTSNGYGGKVSAEQRHGATPAPDRIILTWTSDPATTQSVTWRTDTSVKKATAQIAESEDGPDFEDHDRGVEAVTTAFESDLGPVHYHQADFTGLKPNTLYVYRVGGDGDWSEWNHFRTASDKGDPLTFLYVGDAQNDIHSLWSRLIRTGYKHAPHAQFIIHAGDLVNRGIHDAEWGEWFEAAGWINRTMPSIPVPGNHEYSKSEGRRQITPQWFPQFALPENGLPQLAETSYYIDIQGVRIIALNSNEYQEEQRAWLDTLLAGNPNRWTVISFHHPIYSAARGRDNKELRELWQPIFDKHAVDLVLQGHDHTYARSNLMSGVNARSGKNGTVYVVSVSGPKMYGTDAPEWMERVAGHTQLFQIIRVEGDRLIYEARTARGILYDAFELQKQEGQSNKLINRVPNTPERLKKD